MGMTTPSKEEQQEFINSLPMKTLMAFRNSIFSVEFVESNPSLFIGTAWVPYDTLLRFLDSQDVGLGTSAAFTPTSLTRVKREQTKTSPLTFIKPEPVDNSFLVPTQPAPSKKANPAKPDIIDLLSDSEEEGSRFETVKQDARKQQPDVGKYLPSPDYSSDNDTLEIVAVDFEKVSDSLSTDKSSTCEMTDCTSSSLEVAPMEQHVLLEFGYNTWDAPTAYLDPTRFNQPSTTQWFDPEIISGQLECPRHSVTRETRVSRLEYLSSPPSFFPVPRETTGFICDLRDSRWNLEKEHLLTVDAIIKNKDQESWRGSTGVGGDPVMVTFHPGAKPIQCRRSRLTCQGIFACSAVDRDLVHITRRDIDPSSREKIIAAQFATRSREGRTAEERATIFYSGILKRKCIGKHPSGLPCSGRWQFCKKRLGPTRGHQYFIGCTGWTQTWTKHTTFAIPDDVDERLVKNLIDHKPLRSDKTKDTQECSKIISARIGGKMKECPHAHIHDGVAFTSPIIQHPCGIVRTIYVPLDPAIRIALVLHVGDAPHKHPLPPITKATIDVKQKYTESILAAGAAGRTVGGVDRATTKLILGTNTPADLSPALANQRIKSMLVQEQKSKKYPCGFSFPGAYHLYKKDQLKDPKDCYIQKYYDEGPDTIIYTFFPELLELIGDVASFQGDGSMKRCGETEEWEMSIYFDPLQRAITIARAYHNRATTEQYKLLFDHLRLLTAKKTRSKLGFSRFCADGTLSGMTADMEAAALLGAAQSFITTIDPVHSDVNVESPSELIPYFARLCYVHAKRGVKSLEQRLTPEQYRQVMDFVYVANDEEFEQFNELIDSLDIKDVTSWWKHKTDSKWILPSLIAYKSPMYPEDWEAIPSTTNINEGQHHQTNVATGTGLSLVEAIDSAREFDEGVLKEVRHCLRTGVMKNNQNDLLHRMNRRVQRTSHAQQKASARRERDERTTALQTSLQEEKHKMAESRKRVRELRADLKDAKSDGKPDRSSRSRPTALTSSSGRVKTRSTTTRKTTESVQRKVLSSREIVGDDNPKLAIHTNSAETQANPGNDPAPNESAPSQLPPLELVESAPLHPLAEATVADHDLPSVLSPATNRKRPYTGDHDDGPVESSGDGSNAGTRSSKRTKYPVRPVSTLALPPQKDTSSVRLKAKRAKGWKGYAPVDENGCVLDADGNPVEVVKQPLYD